MEPTILIVKADSMVSIDEIASLVREAGFYPKEVISVKKIDSACFLTPGRIARLKQLVEGNSIKRICIYAELKPRQVTCLAKELKVDVIDKVMLILTIFQQHAGSKEALLQIEMARLKHELPLVREWIRRVKMGELPGFLSMGRYAVDVYYRHIKRRIAKISRELENLRARRIVEREKRRSAGYVHIAIVGYTNAGKTTLFNALTNLSKPTGDEMFTTLSTKSYAIRYCNTTFVLIDTVGFVREIPIDIIESFRAVLEEISSADAILLVIDGSKELERLFSEIDTSLRILRDIGALGKPMIVIINKIDLLDGIRIDEYRRSVEEYFGKHLVSLVDVVPLSALKKININTVKDSLCRYVQRNTMHS
ncbi:MAG: GTPase HflX [Ignisphaera sp.]|nr:GTPase HflX [Ignisphaera sp.]MCX8168568.1 GTPase HflX [Ignisphaera sp.]MDW8085154.1 GTPase HflX [Ignisphaera sp.]